MQVEYNVDLVKDLVTQFKGQPKIQALMEVIEEQMQELCQFFVDLQTKRSLMTAEGKQLDGIGDIAVLSRGEAGEWACIDTSVEVLPDDDYRNYLIFKIWKNTNNCTYYDVQKAFRMFWDKPLYYKEDPDYPAVMLFETGVMKPGEMDVQRLFSLPIIRAAGVGIFITAITQMDEIQYDLPIGSHLGRGLMITHLPEWFPEWPDDYSLYVSAVSPRWGSLTISNDQTATGLVGHEDQDDFTLDILSYISFLGYHPISASYDAENLCIEIEGIGVTAEPYRTTLILDQARIRYATLPRATVAYFESEIEQTIADLKIGIQAAQNFNGYSYAWAGGKGRNLLDPSTVPDENHYVNANNGNLGTASDATVEWRYTDYIPVTPGDEIFFGEIAPTAITAGTAFYNSSKSFVSGVSNSALKTSGGMVTVPENAAYMRHSFRVDTVYNTDWENTVYITLSSNPHEWSPYSNICPITGFTGATVYHSGADTSDPDEISISWQSEAGTVYGGSLDVTTGELTVTHGHIASYNGESLPGAWISDRDVYAPGTVPTSGAQVVYELASPQVYHIGQNQIDALNGVNRIWTNTGDILSLTCLLRDGIGM